MAYICYIGCSLFYLEVKLYDILKHEKGSAFVEHFIKVWKRFLNDCFCIWNPKHGNVDYLTNKYS